MGVKIFVVGEVSNSPVYDRDPVRVEENISAGGALVGWMVVVRLLSGAEGLKDV